MFDKRFISNAIGRSAENPLDRRRFLTAAGIAGAGVGVATLAAAAPAHADSSTGAITDGAILNFALNLEYLEAEFYLHAVTGTGLASNMTDGSGKLGGVVGGHAVPFKSLTIQRIATEIANDEKAHVAFLRSALGSAKVARPSIDLQSSFNAAATAAGLIKAGQTFDPFASDDNFLLGAFLFEDVGVTAYKGAAPLITNKTYLGAAAGILAVEAYHAGIIRDRIVAEDLYHQADAISSARDSLDGPTDDDQGVADGPTTNLVPTDANSVAFGRTAPRVLNIVYLTPNAATKGGFYPNGVNGTINTSGSPSSPTA
ncbi:ferritin-like domain-containing protein [Frondihabitans australicus]|uniref:Ferritin-like protein n=1 Tax=Frondihabitans australicus TaxID=386892 RepID=A0A495IAC8_9MICO|nr:ferritin-like domain-containing protein [Frondihabitans australicus]RKR72969.1 ferritin-like protein [Frondihabitans australicus]